MQNSPLRDLAVFESPYRSVLVQWVVLLTPSNGYFHPDDLARATQALAQACLNPSLEKDFSVTIRSFLHYIQGCWPGQQPSEALASEFRMLAGFYHRLAKFATLLPEECSDGTVCSAYIGWWQQSPNPFPVPINFPGLSDYCYWTHHQGWVTDPQAVAGFPPALAESLMHWMWDPKDRLRAMRIQPLMKRWVEEVWNGVNFVLGEGGSGGWEAWKHWDRERLVVFLEHCLKLYQASHVYSALLPLPLDRMTIPLMERYGRLAPYFSSLPSYEKILLFHATPSNLERADFKLSESFWACHGALHRVPGWHHQARSHLPLLYHHALETWLTEISIEGMEPLKASLEKDRQEESWWPLRSSPRPCLLRVAVVELEDHAKTLWLIDHWCRLSDWMTVPLEPLLHLVLHPGKWGDDAVLQILDRCHAKGWLASLVVQQDAENRTALHHAALRETPVVFRALQRQLTVSTFKAAMEFHDRYSQDPLALAAVHEAPAWKAMVSHALFGDAQNILESLPADRRKALCMPALRRHLTFGPLMLSDFLEIQDVRQMVLLADPRFSVLYWMQRPLRPKDLEPLTEEVRLALISAQGLLVYQRGYDKLSFFWFAAAELLGVFAETSLSQLESWGLGPRSHRLPVDSAPNQPGGEDERQVRSYWWSRFMGHPLPRTTTLEQLRILTSREYFGFYGLLSKRERDLMGRIRSPEAFLWLCDHDWACWYRAYADAPDLKDAAASEDPLALRRLMLDLHYPECKNLTIKQEIVEALTTGAIVEACGLYRHRPIEYIELFERRPDLLATPWESYKPLWRMGVRLSDCFGATPGDDWKDVQTLQERRWTFCVLWHWYNETPPLWTVRISNDPILRRVASRRRQPSSTPTMTNSLTLLVEHGASLQP
jgi:hypothetical protein